MDQLALGEGQHAAFADQEVAVGRRDVHDPRCCALTVLGELDAQSGPALQNLGDDGLVAPVEVLDEEERDR